MNLENSSVQSEKKTYTYLDFFKALGLLCVIIAHVNAPYAVTFLRSFDVPFLVMISASLAFLNDRNERYISYVWKRIKRLIIPAWIYLTFCTLVFAAMKIKSPVEMLPSFLFQKYQFGFVWIVWLYFVMALIVPCQQKIFTKCSDWNLLHGTVMAISLIAIGLIFEIICAKTDLYALPVLEYTFFYIVPYGFVSSLGIVAVKVQRKWLYVFSVLFFICSLLFGFYYSNAEGKLIRPDAYNQPARFYYIAFSSTVSFLLYAFFKDRDFRFFRCPLIVFLSRHSLWIYLWHSFVNLIVFKFSDFWLLRYVLTLTASCLIVFVQNLIVGCIHSENRIVKEVVKFFRG